MSYYRGETESRQKNDKEEEVTVNCKACGTLFYIPKWMPGWALRKGWSMGPYCPRCRSASARMGGSGRTYTK